MAESRYFVGKGKLFVGERDSSGNPVGLEWLGNVPNLVLSTDETDLQHKESYTGLNLTDKIVPTGQTATASFTLEEFTKENLTKFLRGTFTAIAAATITEEVVIGYPGKWSRLSQANIQTWTSLTNSTALETYVLGVDYNVDMKGGLIEILEGGAITEGQSLKANYAAGAMEQVSGFTVQPKDYYLYFSGLNQAEDLQPVLIDVYKFRPKPIGSIELITDEFGNYEIEGAVQYDPLRPDTTTNGRFFKIRQTVGT